MDVAQRRQRGTGGPSPVFFSGLGLNWRCWWRRRRRRGGRCNLLLYRRRGRWSRVRDPLDAFLEALQSFAQSLAELRQPLGAKDQKCHHAKHYKVPWLK
jgi:pimeloyl-ACP methyl ester carboxylesterase